ncbi:endogenous retrovirus group K member 5 Gag polyprotein-like [Nycticebus coucang]|uniref:endogenous retrovirus group K member 5 Gag polyprotein-like n=1 Tax=Nycticebus coucang TaxID=9470 RepID=UPI00234C1AB8|nr:endogenous retrovirus group K member 5 Gag polyprotein-like [Nycticebus coucang]
MRHALIKEERIFNVMLQHLLVKNGFNVSLKRLEELIHFLIKQGAEEPYQDFISRLEEAINRMLPPSEGTSLLLKQLEACMDASPAIVQGMAFAAAMQGQKFSAYVKNTFNKEGKGPTAPTNTCYNCGKPGRMQKDCKQSHANKPRGDPPGLCPRCKKGRHWKNECKSKFHKDGTPLNNKGDTDPEDQDVRRSKN